MIFKLVPAAPVITVFTFVFTFLMRCVSIVRSLYFRIFSPSFLRTRRKAAEMQWKYTCIESETRHQMDVGGQSHAPAALPSQCGPFCRKEWLAVCGRDRGRGLFRHISTCFERQNPAKRTEHQAVVRTYYHPLPLQYLTSKSISCIKNKYLTHWPSLPRHRPINSVHHFLRKSLWFSFIYIF
jgi:hypothetical protein